MQQNRFLETDNRGMVLVKFGKFKGQFLVDVAAENPNYLQWVLDEMDLPDGVRLEIEMALNED